MEYNKEKKKKSHKYDTFNLVIMEIKSIDLLIRLFICVLLGVALTALTTVCTMLILVTPKRNSAPTILSSNISGHTATDSDSEHEITHSLNTNVTNINAGIGAFDANGNAVNFDGIEADKIIFVQKT